MRRAWRSPHREKTISIVLRFVERGQALVALGIYSISKKNSSTLCSFFFLQKINIKDKSLKIAYIHWEFLTLSWKCLICCQDLFFFSSKTIIRPNSNYFFLQGLIFQFFIKLVFVWSSSRDFAFDEFGFCSTLVKFIMRAREGWKGDTAVILPIIW